MKIGDRECVYSNLEIMHARNAHLNDGKSNMHQQWTIIQLTFLRMLSESIHSLNNFEFRNEMAIDFGFCSNI